MKVFEMFAGVGGFSQGFPKEWESVGFSEIDRFASMVLKYHYPSVPNYGDCTKINYAEVPYFDVLTGGSPCQDFSIAGKRRGLAGARSSLAWEYIRCLRSKKPRYFIWENVKGVMSSRGGWDFANLLTAFSESGYSLWWQVLNAKDFGVPQNRERIFVIGFREGSPKEVFFERNVIEKFNATERDISSDGAEGYRGGSNDSDSADGENGAGRQLYIYDPYNRAISKNQEATTTLRTNHANGNPQIIVQNKGANQHYRVYGKDGLAPTLQSQSGMSSQKHPYIVASRGRNPQNPKSRKSGLPTEQMLEPNLEGISNTLTGVQKDNYLMTVGLIKESEKPKGNYLPRERVLSDKGGARAVSTHESQMPFYESAGQIRKLMPLECERLMSWSDEWTKYGVNEKGETIEISDSQRYRQCGNGVVSSVVRVIIKNLL